MIKFLKKFIKYNSEGKRYIFDSEIWKQNPEQRKYFVKSILDKQLGIGYSKRELEEQYGRPNMMYLEEDRWSYTIEIKAKRKYVLAFYYENGRVAFIKPEVRKLYHNGYANNL